MRPGSSSACAALIVLLTAAGCGLAEKAREVGPPRPDILLTADSEMFPGRIPPGASVSTVLARHDLHPDDVSGIVGALEGVFDARRFRSGQAYRLERTLDGCARLVEYEIDADRYLRVSARPDGTHAFDASIEHYETQAVEAVVAGAIDREASSLFAAMDAAGELPDLSMALADIFSGEVDFNSDVQPGDRFRLRVEKVLREGRFVRYGPVSVAQLLNDGRELVAIRFTPPGGQPGYYDPEGRSLKRFFLRSPLRFEPTVTSGFSRARMHPVLHRMRAHLGVDYRAPVGAPVVAVAHGVVTGAGWRGGGGRTVSIRHASGYETSYLHLSSIAAGIRPGVRVSQGQMIGRVGASGLATGPHLDYRLRKNGVWVNPLTEHRRLPPGEPIRPDDRAAFAGARDAAMASLGLADGAMTAAKAGGPGSSGSEASPD